MAEHSQQQTEAQDATHLHWWQTGVVYQIYPRSFQDTNGDGIGDLRGILARLDYLVALGVDALWISPIYPSPMADFGYDVADYTGIDPLFGTMEDFDMLLAAAHRKGLRVILDFVPNHTSSQHPWFLESRSSRTNPKRDWYIWRDAQPSFDDWKPARERLPSNWTSQFGGPAWTWDEATEQFYLHSFLREQPDLNWRNPAVVAAMLDAMRFWLDKGVDGFRMDVLWLLVKDAFFRDNAPDGQHAPHNADQPETHAIVAQMRALMDSYGATIFDNAPRMSSAPISAGEDPQRLLSHGAERVLIGEIYLPLDRLVQYYGNDAAREAHLPFNFQLIQTPWEAGAIADVIRRYEALLPPNAWPNYVLGNHDQSRLATRIGDLQARAAAMLLLTLRGTPTMYYGDELGMRDVPIAPDQVQDPAEKNDPGKGRGRDPERSLMLWLDAPNAGFAPPDAVPWLPLAADWPTRNAAAQSRPVEGKPPRSMLTLYRRLLALRRQHDTLHAGGIADVIAEGTVLRYRRVALEDGASTDFLVVLNLGNEIATTSVPPGTIVLTTVLDGEGAIVGGEDGSPETLTIEAGEGLLIALD